jgi:hypothetical protein
MSSFNDVVTLRRAFGDRSVISRRADNYTSESRIEASVGRGLLRRPNAPSSRVGRVTMSPRAFRRLIIGWGGAAAMLLALSLTMRWWLG